MARWRGKKRQQEMLFVMIFGLIVLGFLGWLVSQIPWNSVFFGVFIIVAVIFSVFAFFQLFFVIKFHFDSERERRQRFEKASYVQGAIHETSLDDREFEHYVGTLYENLGFSVTVTPKSHDRGIDLILKDKNGKTTGVQVKLYKSSKVGEPELRDLVGGCLKKYDKMLFVTSSNYLPSAQKYAAEQGVVLVNGEALTAMAQKVFGENYKSKSFAFNFHKKMGQLV
jgi:uncharacterized membrane protein